MGRPNTQITRPCDGCGSSLTRPKSGFRRERAYCSHACSAKHNPTPKSAAMWEGKCCNCDKEIVKYASSVGATESPACSKACARSFQGKRRVAEGTWHQPRKPKRGAEVPCETCGTLFYKHVGKWADKSRFCSLKCRRQSQPQPRLSILCEHCGVDVQVQPSRAAQRFCNWECRQQWQTAQSPHGVHNGRPIIVGSSGYLTVYEPTHPNANKFGRVPLHRLLMSQKIGRALLATEHVDHIDGNPRNNVIENLQVLSASQHVVKTTADMQRARLRTLEELDALRREQAEMQDKLAEYERRFGPLQQTTDAAG